MRYFSERYIGLELAEWSKRGSSAGQSLLIGAAGKSTGRFCFLTLMGSRSFDNRYSGLWFAASPTFLQVTCILGSPATAGEMYRYHTVKTAKLCRTCAGT
jgi:hypothetical protein